MKDTLCSYERRLGLTTGVLRHWIHQGILPLKLSRDRRLELTPQQLVMLLYVSSYFKACCMGIRKGHGGTGMAKNIKYYWALLAEGFRCWKLAEKEIKELQKHHKKASPDVKIELWTYFRDGFPHVCLTRDGKPAAKDAVNLGAKLAELKRDIKDAKPLEKFHPDYELSIP